MPTQRQDSQRLYSTCFGVAHDFGMLCKHHGFLSSSRKKYFKRSICSIYYKNSKAQEFLDGILFLDGLTIIKTLWNSKLDSLETKGSHFADTFTGNAALKDPMAVKPLLWSKGLLPPNDNLGKKSAKYVRHLVPEKKTWRLEIQQLLLW